MHRPVSLNLRVTEEERQKLFALAADRDLNASTLIRHWLRDAYAARFGANPPPTPTREAQTKRRARSPKKAAA